MRLSFPQNMNKQIFITSRAENNLRIETFKEILSELQRDFLFRVLDLLPSRSAIHFRRPLLLRSAPWEPGFDLSREGSILCWSIDLSTSLQGKEDFAILRFLLPWAASGLLWSVSLADPGLSTIEQTGGVVRQRDELKLARSSSWRE